jgi:hypothetical protein
MSEKDDITSKLRKMMAMGATPEHGLIVIRWHYISTMEEWRNEVDLCAEAAEEIERLRVQRDEARRECCRHMAHGVMSAEDYAKYLNWDCFKENEK